MRDCHVYARCKAGRKSYLQKLFTGTRPECKGFVQQRVAAGQPTHFLEVSSLETDAATRKFCDGTSYDPVTCTWTD